MQVIRIHFFPEIDEIGKMILDNPAEAFKLHSELHRAYDQYRRQPGAKLHTTSFQVHPPAGASGDRYTEFILLRTGEFALIGQQVDVLG